LFQTETIWQLKFQGSHSLRVTVKLDLRLRSSFWPDFNSMKISETVCYLPVF